VNGVPQLEKCVPGLADQVAEREGKSQKVWSVKSGQGARKIASRWQRSTHQPAREKHCALPRKRVVAAVLVLSFRRVSGQAVPLSGNQTSRQTFREQSVRFCNSCWRIERQGSISCSRKSFIIIAFVSELTLARRMLSSRVEIANNERDQVQASSRCR
jgi:hypothetical protein